LSGSRYLKPPTLPEVADKASYADNVWDWGFVVNEIQNWQIDKQVKAMYITPGSPWENRHIESFHVKIQDECLNRKSFGSLWKAGG
jgi:transposase InsO family protein